MKRSKAVQKIACLKAWMIENKLPKFKVEKSQVIINPNIPNYGR
jgi:hypothetical protein